MHADTCQKEWFQRLESGLALLGRALARGTEALNPLEKEGALRRFEYCLDLSWKAAKEYLQECGLRINPVTPREVFRQAAAAGLVSNPQVWIQMLDHRTLLAHSYDGVVHDEVIVALSARYFPAMEQLRDFLAAPEPEGGMAESVRIEAQPT
ncbi:MAG TPA: HI0074 family nucleotidyltransferase substrate-binding subunit [Chthoniobacterales bacterium]|nr:HI0074 family nucleotidyltransferase substrate-binding subunit [Chthoniobacterales bacterium]